MDIFLIAVGIIVAGMLFWLGWHIAPLIFNFIGNAFLLIISLFVNVMPEIMSGLFILLLVGFFYWFLGTILVDIPRKFIKAIFKK